MRTINTQCAMVGRFFVKMNGLATSIFTITVAIGYIFILFLYSNDLYIFCRSKLEPDRIRRQIHQHAQCIGHNNFQRWYPGFLEINT
jgi:hypothetical protein